MGRWSQARHRGRGKEPTRAFPLDPPTAGEWNFGNDGFTEVVGTTVGSVCAVGADGFDMRSGNVAIQPDPETWQVGNAPCDGDVVLDGSDGGTWTGQIRWTLLGVAVSDWSLTKTTTF